MRWTRLLHYVRLVLGLMAECLQDRNAIVHAITWRSAAPLLLVPGTGNRLVVHCHGSEVTRAGRVGRRVQLATYRKAAARVSVSRFTAGVLRDTVGLDSWVIPPAVPRLPPSASRNRGGTNTKVLSVGRFVDRKGHLELFAAVERLRTKGLGVTLTIAGGAGPLSGQLNDLLRTSSEWLTIIEDPPDHVLADCYEQADVFALLSRDVATEFEGFGIVFLEASSWGLPVVAGRSGGTSDAVQEGVTGRLASNVDEAADHLADLAMHPGLRAAMGEAGRAWARTHAEDVLAERYTELHAALSTHLRSGSAHEH